MRRPERGFTLIEVMAAVAVIAIVFTTLARVASQGLQSQGTSKRRFEASLLADAELAEIEAELMLGVVPRFGRSEFEAGLFDVVIDVGVFDLASVIPVAAAPSEDAAGAGLAPPTLPGDAPDRAPVRTITVVVSWTEGANDLRVTRRTFGVDFAALQAQVSAGGGSPFGSGTVPQ